MAELGATETSHRTGLSYLSFHLTCNGDQKKFFKVSNKNLLSFWKVGGDNISPRFAREKFRKMRRRRNFFKQFSHNHLKRDKNLLKKCEERRRIILLNKLA